MHLQIKHIHLISIGLMLILSFNIKAEDDFFEVTPPPAVTETPATLSSQPSTGEQKFCDKLISQYKAAKGNIEAQNKIREEYATQCVQDSAAFQLPPDAYSLPGKTSGTLTAGSPENDSIENNTALFATDKSASEEGDICTQLSKDIENTKGEPLRRSALKDRYRKQCQRGTYNATPGTWK